MAGGSVHPGPGVPMAAMSGRLAAATLMARLGSTRRSSAGAYLLVVRRCASATTVATRLTLIAFVGSVFSPYYRRAWKRRQRAVADEHCALNVCRLRRRRRAAGR